MGLCVLTASLRKPNERRHSRRTATGLAADQIYQWKPSCSSPPCWQSVLEPRSAMHDVTNFLTLFWMNYCYNCYHPCTNSVARWVVFSSLSLSVSVYLCVHFLVCNILNITWTVWGIIMKFYGSNSQMLVRIWKWIFQWTAARGWRFNVSDVQVWILDVALPSFLIFQNVSLVSNGCEEDTSSSSRMRVMNHWSATKQHLHPQNVAEISRHSVLSEDRIWQCGTSSGSCHKDTD